MSEDDGLKAMGQVIQIDEGRIRDHLGEMVRGTVEETLNALLDAEADRLCGAGRYERSQGRQDTRAGSYERSLHTVAGEVNLKVPKLRRQTFETAIIERYRRRRHSGPCATPCGRYRGFRPLLPLLGETNIWTTTLARSTKNLEKSAL
jgi:putative transposase